MVTKPVLEIKKDIPNEDFECNPNGECWCKEEEFPQLPASSSKDICYSPDEIKRFHRSEVLKAPNFDVK